MLSLKVYLIGSLRNPAIPGIANELRALGFDVFDDWFAAGPEADDKWRDYEKARGNTYIEALEGLAADHVFQFDFKHLNDSDAAVLVLPAGKSGCIEFGYMRGQNKPGWILLDNPERWDVMFKFASGVYTSLEDLKIALVRYEKVEKRISEQEIEEIKRRWSYHPSIF